MSAPHAPSPQPIIDWLLGPARLLPSPVQLIEGLCAHLIEAGLPIWRVTLHLPQYHPLIGAAIYEWKKGAERVRELRFPREGAASRRFHHSPVGQVRRTGLMVRRRLVGPDAELDFPVLEELAAQGGTDYALLPMQIGTGVMAGCGMTSDLAEGFTAAQVALGEALMPALGAVSEIFVQREKASQLLDTYVGHEAGQRILSGQLVLGAARSIEAVIFFCDMRGFTTLSETLQRDALLAMMNDYFAAMVGPVQKAGGEILKFMGDGMLAIFRLGDGDREDEACARALIAALEASAALDAVNARRSAAGGGEIDGGIALHIGTVYFGNIGAADRLDFTVIGPAVNRAARIEAMTRVLGGRVLTSRQFARVCPVQLVSCGKHELKGVPNPQELFKPGLAAAPAEAA